MPNIDKIFSWVSIILSLSFLMVWPAFLYYSDSIITRLIPSVGVGMFLALIYIGFSEKNDTRITGIFFSVILALLILLENDLYFFRKEYIFYRIVGLFVGFLFLFIFKKIVYRMFNFYKNIIINNDKYLNIYCLNLVNKIKNNYIDFFRMYNKGEADWGNIFRAAIKESISSRSGWEVKNSDDDNFLYRGQEIHIDTKYETYRGLPAVQILSVSFAVAMAELTSHISQEKKLEKNEKIFEKLKQQDLQSVTKYILEKYVPVIESEIKKRKRQ